MFNNVSKKCYFLGLLFGVFDGHAGSSCAQVISKRLYYYIAACLLPKQLRRNYLESITTNSKIKLIQFLNDNIQFVDDLRDLYKSSFIDFMQELNQVSI